MIDFVLYFFIYILPFVVFWGMMIFIAYFVILVVWKMIEHDDMLFVSQETIEKNLIDYGVDSD